MDPLSKYWYLEHITTGKKIILQAGENTLGRHSTCKFVLQDYEFLSRKHAKVIVSIENGVILEQMNALNGVFINERKLKENTRSLSCGDRIGLGVEIEKPNAEVPANYAIFILKQTCTKAEDIVLISDDEGDDGKINPETSALNNDEENYKEISLEKPEIINNNNSINKNSRIENEHRAIHLPKLPEVKKELLSQASKEIENIFGEPDEELLESVFQINPYVYKQLNNNNIATTCEKIFDGDVIELNEEIPSTKVVASPTRNEVILDDNDGDYDENFAMSQAVLREMKEEMADALADLSEEECENQVNEEMFLYKLKTDEAIHIQDDEIINIEDDDDELFSKVADWSSKLLSQKVLSQIYPVEDKEHSDNESGVERQILQLFNDATLRDDNEEQQSEINILTKQKSKALRIESSDSEDDATSSNCVSCPGDKPSHVKPKLRQCSVRLKSIDIAQYQQKDNETDDSYKSSVADDSNLQDNSKVVLEVILVPALSPSNSLHVKSSSKSKQKKCKTRKRSSSISVLSDLNGEKLSQRTRNNPQNIKQSKERLIKPTDIASVAESGTPTKNLYSTRLRNRSKSCFLERPIEDNVDLKPSTLNILEDKCSAKTSLKTSARSKLCDEISEPLNKTKELKNKPIEILATAERKSPIVRLRSARLLNRSNSCLIDQPLSVTEGPTQKYDIDKFVSSLKPSTLSTINDQTSRGPTLVEPPNMPVHRGKLRGVSAENKETTKKNYILEKQRSLDYQTEMKHKWYQKPKDKKKEYEQNKKMRREQLQKLAERSTANASADNSNKQKRKPMNVPTLSNSNRGEFLTKEVLPPTAKKPKLDTANERATTPSVKILPKRRATIECFSQKLNDTDAGKSSSILYSRPPERKEAEIARNQRTCNRVTFADMDRDFKFRQNLAKMAKRNRHVRFNDNIQIKIIDRVEGANKKVQNVKDTKKFSLSKYSERREWAQTKGKLENYTDLITGNILSWGNQWLSVRNPNDVAESDVLLPIPNEFKSYKQYKEIIIPLMKVELLTTIEREYEISKSTFEVSLESFSRESTRNRPRYLLVTRYGKKPVKKYDLYTLCSGDSIKETFATLPRIQRIAGSIYELTFDILQKDISMEMLLSVKKITVRPVVDNMRVELGAFNAVYQLGRSPLFQRILQPSENVISFDSKILKDTRYRGFSKLNDHQIDICQSTWIRLVDDSTPSITLIQGPPGTGKSVVISNLTLQCMYGSTNHTLDRKILICAHSNAAVDNITLYLNRARNCMGHSQFQLLRFGCFEKMDRKVREVSLDHHLSNERAEKRKRLSADNIDNLIQQQQVLKTEIAELKQKSYQMSYMQQQLQSKERQLRLITEQLNPPLTPREVHELSRKFIQRANIVCTTLSSCVKLATFIDYFDACIIDEATQCTEPWTLLPLQFGVRGLVLVGDTQQLPATVLSQKAIDFGLGNSMFARIQRNLKQQLSKERRNHFVHTKVFKLSMQYRMHPEICRWPNKYFYEDELVNADCTQRLVSPIIPYCVINLSFTRDTSDISSRSISNDEEAHFVAKLLIELDKHMSTQRYKYGLITPYSNQCYALSKVIPSSMMITPHTVDAYQGQERDVIILSNARTRGVGFLTNYQRLNVAITRPRRCLIICGNFDDLQAVDMWRHLLEDARSRQVFFDLKRSDIDELNRTLISKILVKPIEIDDNSSVGQSPTKLC